MGMLVILLVSRAGFAPGMRRLFAAALFCALVVSALLAPAAMAGTTISARGSQFGTMLWGPKRQAVYVFERDGRGPSRCYGSCARAWPPVYANGTPVAGRGVRSALLGTTRRRGGRRQVTYAGRPLYYYVNEGPGRGALPQRRSQRRPVVGRGAERQAPALTPARRPRRLSRRRAPGLSTTCASPGMGPSRA